MRISDIDKAIKSVGEAQDNVMESVGKADHGLLTAMHILHKVREKIHAKRVDQRTRRET
jgi:hypothetical protein